MRQTSAARKPVPGVSSLPPGPTRPEASKDASGQPIGDPDNRQHPASILRRHALDVGTELSGCGPAASLQTCRVPMSDILFEIADNPIPQGAQAGWLETPDGRRLRFARFPATGRPLKGTVIVVQGRNEYIEKYFETASDLAARGFAVLTFDLRGQGLSERLIRDPKRGYVDSFHEYVGDLEFLIDEVGLPDCRPPYYLLAHSTGSLVALLAAPRLANRIRRMVLSTPLIELASIPLSPSMLRLSSRILYNLGMGRMYMSGKPGREPVPFATNKLTSDHRRYTRNQKIVARHPELGLGGATVTWIVAACRAADTVRRDAFVATVTIPTLMIASGADEVVSTTEIAHLARRLRSGSLLTIDGARHELLQEADIYREQFLAAFDAFVPGTDSVGF